MLICGAVEVQPSPHLAFRLVRVVFLHHHGLPTICLSLSQRLTVLHDKTWLLVNTSITIFLKLVFNSEIASVDLILHVLGTVTSRLCDI